MITDNTEKGNEEAAKGVRKIIDEELFISYCSSAIERPKANFLQETLRKQEIFVK